MRRCPPRVRAIVASLLADQRAMLAVAESLREIFPANIWEEIQSFDPAMAIADDNANASHSSFL
jgi:hypothetical protein